MKCVGKGKSLEGFSSKSSRKPKTCFAFARVFILRHTTLRHCHPPRSSCGIVDSATSSGTWREVFCETQGERDHTQSPSSFSADFRKSMAQRLLGEQPCWSLTVVISILGVSEVQIPMPPSPLSPKAMSSPGVSSSQAQTWHEDVAGFEGV